MNLPTEAQVKILKISGYTDDQISGITRIDAIRLIKSIREKNNQYKEFSSAN